MRGGNNISAPWVLSIDPWRKGFGFVFFEGSNRLIDWGLQEAPSQHRNEHCLLRLRELIGRYGPDVLILEDWQSPGCRRCPRVRRLLASAFDLTNDLDIRAVSIAPRKIHEAFAFLEGAVNKHKVSCALAALYPELERHLPPFRKVWMSEDPRTSIFDACAMALTFYRLYQKSPSKTGDDNQHTYVSTQTSKDSGD